MAVCGEVGRAVYLLGERGLGPIDALAAGAGDGRLVFGIKPNLAAERRNLDRLGAELDVRKPETTADDPAITETALDLLRLRGGGNVKIFGTPSQEQVAYTSSNEISGMPELLQPIHDLQRIWVNIAPGQRMLGAW
jgi:hypothetical protein